MTKYLKIKGDKVYELSKQKILYKLKYYEELSEIEFKINKKDRINIIISENRKDWKIKLKGKSGINIDQRGNIDIAIMGKNNVEIDIEGKIILALWLRGGINPQYFNPIRLKIKEEIQLNYYGGIKLKSGSYCISDGKIWTEEEWEIKEIVE